MEDSGIRKLLGKVCERTYFLGQPTLHKVVSASDCSKGREGRRGTVDQAPSVAGKHKPGGVIAKYNSWTQQSTQKNAP